MNIYPRHPEADDTYYIGGSWTPACLVATNKRFTDAELAAEYWSAGNEWRADESLRAIIKRFATLPHATEDTK